MLPFLWTAAAGPGSSLDSGRWDCVVLHLLRWSSLVGKKSVRIWCCSGSKQMGSIGLGFIINKSNFNLKNAISWPAAGVAPCRRQWECAVPEGAVAAQGQALRKGWECSWGSGEQSWGSFWVTLWTNCSQNCYTRCCLKESYFPSHVPDFSKPSVPVKNFQVVGFGVRGEKAEGKLEAGVGSWVSAGLCKEALYSYNEGSAEKCFQLDTQMIKQALNKSCGSTAGKEILLRLKINILCCMYAKLFFYF